MISGGLGGLGRSIARWMMNRGAKNIMILSRSGAQSEAALALLEDLRHGGVNALAPSCDITDETALKDVLARYKDIIPPIRGCIQGSMVLRVSFCIEGPLLQCTLTDHATGWII